MPIITLSPLRWDWAEFAKYLQSPAPPPTPYISDKIARDIGMSDADLARLRHVWPSDGTDRTRF